MYWLQDKKNILSYAQLKRRIYVRGIICFYFYFMTLQEAEADEPDEKPISVNDDPEYRHDGYIELVLKVMARMCDGQNHFLQVFFFL